MAAGAGMSGRKWRLFAALAVVLPLALAAHSWETALEWWRQSSLFAKNVPAGGTATYGGAEWRLVRLTKLATRKNGSAVVLAELEARVTDPETFSIPPCNVALTVETGQRWLPVFLAPRELRQSRPDLAEAPSCVTAKAAAVKQGDTVRMADIFLIPWQEFERVDLRLSVPPGRPDYLLFRKG